MPISLTVPDNGNCVCCLGCTDVTFQSELVGYDICPTTSFPCSGTEEESPPASCAGLTFDKTIYSREFPNYCREGKTPRADVFAGFDDFGSVTGETTLSCNRTGEGCVSCGFSGTITPLIENVGSNNFKLKLELHAENAYWGGPYGYDITVYWYFE